MEFKRKELSNGLNIIGELNPNAKSAAVGFFVKTGARDETMDINGVSHFLEHMMFKGTDRLSAFEVNEAFDRTGARFNAFTSEEATAYYAAVLPEYLAEVTGLWCELMRPSLRTDDFDIEKNVIKEEIAMYQDMPSFDVADRCRTLYFAGHPCGHSVLGSVKSIDALTAEQMREYFSRRYAPDNMVVTFVGNFEWEKVTGIVEEKCSGWKRGSAGRETPDYGGRQASERIEKDNLSNEHICLVTPSVSAQDPRRFAADILATIIGDSVGSRFFWEIVDKALAETATMQPEEMDGTGAFYTYIRCQRENVEKVMDIVTEILRQVRSEGVTEDELRKARNKHLSAIALKNETPMGRFVDLGFNWLYLGKYRTVEADIEEIKKVTVADITALLKDLDLTKFVKLSLGPKD